MFHVLYNINGFLNIHNSLSNYSTPGFYHRLDIDIIVKPMMLSYVYDCVLLFIEAEYRFSLNMIITNCNIKFDNSHVLLLYFSFD
jgi:hypothetical protein